MAAPILSICMPVYNSIPHLRECIDSILTQSFTNFEVVIVDDGSTDDTISLITSYADSRIRLIRNTHDYITSLNLTIQEARGKYIVRMDSDDIMLPHRLAFQYAYMEAHPHIDILGSCATTFGAYERAFGRQGKVTVEDLLRGNALIHPTVIMRAESIRKHNLRYDPSFIYAEDYHLWIQAVKCGLQLVNVGEKVLKYRISESQVSTRHRFMQYKNAKRVQMELSRWLSRDEEIWAKQHPPCISHTTAKKLTVIIPFLNEGKEVARTVESIRHTAGDTVEIMVINDQSNDGYNYRKDLSPYNIHYIYNTERLGVAASRDLGVSLCGTPYFLLLDAHMRFYDRVWAEKIIAALEADRRCLLCCQTRALSKDDEGNITLQKECLPSYGAYLQLDKRDFMVDIKWSNQESDPSRPIEDIPVVLGAGYAAGVAYWKHLKGLAGLRYYGSDEAYISLKVWMEGGRCRLLKDVVAGHIYRTKAPYKKFNEEEMYNNLLIAETLLPATAASRVHAACLLRDRHTYHIATQLLKENRDEVYRLKQSYKRIFTKTMADFLPLNLLKASPDYRLDDELLARIPAYGEYLLAHIPSQYGLASGKMGVVLGMCHLADYLDDGQWFIHAASLLKEVENAIDDGLLPWNFRHGACGVGWGLLYLYARGYIDRSISRIIEKVDHIVATVNAEACHDCTIDTGLGGLLAYAAVRRLYAEEFPMPEGFPILDSAACRVANATSQFAACYYAFLYMNRQENEASKPDIEIREWCGAPMFLPRNPGRWDTSLAHGCLGVVVQAIVQNKIRKEVAGTV